MTELLKPNSVYAFMIYGTFCYLAIMGKINPNIVENAFLILISFYFGKVSSQNGGYQNGNTSESIKK